MEKKEKEKIKIERKDYYELWKSNNAQRERKERIKLCGIEIKW